MVVVAAGLGGGGCDCRNLLKLFRAHDPGERKKKRPSIVLCAMAPQRHIRSSESGAWYMFAFALVSSRGARKAYCSLVKRRR